MCEKISGKKVNLVKVSEITCRNSKSVKDIVTTILSTKTSVTGERKVLLVINKNDS